MLLLPRFALFVFQLQHLIVLLNRMKIIENNPVSKLELNFEAVYRLINFVFCIVICLFISIDN